jgi:hypothetical protein
LPSSAPGSGGPDRVRAQDDRVGVGLRGYLYEAILIAGLAPAQKFTFVGTYVGEAMSAATDIAMLASGITKDECV